MRRSLLLATLVALLTPSGAVAQSWSALPTPNPPHLASAFLAAVSCSSDTSCVAVGAGSTSSGLDRVLAERWDGTAWTLTPPAASHNWRESDLSAVSCTAPNACIAVGSATTLHGKQVTLGERWDGSHWHIQSTPDPSPSLPIHALAGVWCTSRSNCLAVGDYGRDTTYSPFRAATFHALVERWNGRRWSSQTPVRTGTGDDAGLAAVACFRASSCLAVGSETGSSGESAPLALAWNGRRWRRGGAHSHGESADLDGVSCWAANGCMAVGEYFVSRDRELLTERWNGHGFSVQLPSRGDAGAAELSGVSCRSASDCVAVGGAGGADPTGGLAEGWNGVSWTIQPTLGDDQPFIGVSCRPAFCMAVGRNGDHTLAARLS